MKNCKNWSVGEFRWLWYSFIHIIFCSFGLYLCLSSSRYIISSRFGCDIKQFCSNVCLEDYKKGLKVCSYCQKDISGGEGVLAPIGDKGQFKDFCEQKCLQKYEFMHFGRLAGLLK